MENTGKSQSNDAANKAGNKTANNQANADKTQNQNKNASQGGKDAAAQQQNQQADNQIADNVGNVVRGDTGAIKDILSQAKESTGEVASQAYGIAAKKATSVIDEQKSNLTQGLTSVADSIRQIGENLRGTDEPTGITNIAAQYTSTAAQKVEQMSGYLERQDLNALLGDVKDLARTNPALFLGGAFTLGILAARFFKSGNPNQALTRRSQYADRNFGSRRNDRDFNRARNSDNQVTTFNPDSQPKLTRSDDEVITKIHHDDTIGGSTTIGGTTSANDVSQNKGG